MSYVSRDVPSCPRTSRGSTGHPSSECPPKENLLVENIPCNACKTDVPSEMNAILPDGYSYRVKTYENKKPENFCGAPKIAFDATIFCNIFSEQEVMKWLRMFQDK